MGVLCSHMLYTNEPSADHIRVCPSYDPLASRLPSGLHRITVTSFFSAPLRQGSCDNEKCWSISAEVASSGTFHICATDPLLAVANKLGTTGFQEQANIPLPPSSTMIVSASNTSTTSSSI